ncbi:MAG: PDZ domain-containing protein [Streptomycetaceae bacterium]|nr:PDZ domain-containing protein [Streptomycetaceae bacterium]
MQVFRDDRATKWVLVAALSGLLTAGGVAAYADDPGGASASTGRSGACAELPTSGEPPQLPAPTRTTVDTLRQAYDCILDNAYAGSALDTRVMLRDGFKAATEELIRRGRDQPTATLAGLTGHRKRDWDRFAATMQTVLNAVSGDEAARQAVAGAALTGMVASLGDNHAGWESRRVPPQSGPQYSYGFREGVSGRPTRNIQDATPPFYVDLLRAGGPADQAGLKRGDILVAANDVPLVSNGMLNGGVLGDLHAAKATDTLRLTVTRPATGATWTVTLHAETVTPTAPAVEATLLPGGIAKVTVPAFAPGAADAALGKIAELRTTTTLRGIVFDVRGNGGGRAEEVGKLISSFVHGKVIARDCDIRNRCTDDRTDDTVPLLGLPMTVLTNGLCASACEGFTGAVKYLGIGKVIGTRTAGAASGLQRAYLLNDNSVLVMPKYYRFVGDDAMVDEIGVPADFEIPLTAEDLSFGRDPALDKARELLAG